jgi:hypothetical protein
VPGTPHPGRNQRGALARYPGTAGVPVRPGRRRTHRTAHTVVLARGAQAGFFLHGLLLAVPIHLEHEKGPGLNRHRLTPHVAHNLRTQVAHPTIAAALATATIIGLSIAETYNVDETDLADDASTLTVRKSGENVDYTVPGYARGLLRAAREMRGTATGRQNHSGRLFSGSGATQGDFARAAERLQLSLPGELDTFTGAYSAFARASDWHCVSTAWWLGKPLHGPPAADPPTTRGLADWMRTW